MAGCELYLWCGQWRWKTALCCAGLGWCLAPPPPARWWKYRGKIFVDENRNIWSDMEAMFDEVSIWEYYTTNIFPDWQSLLTISPIVEIFAEKCLQAPSIVIYISNYLTLLIFMFVLPVPGPTVDPAAHRPQWPQRLPGVERKVRC